MEEFNAKDDLKPDVNDRPSTRASRSAAKPRFTVSRQPMMIVIGVLVLLLVIVSIHSALKRSGQQQVAQPINLPTSSTVANSRLSATVDQTVGQTAQQPQRSTPTPSVSSERSSLAASSTSTAITSAQGVPSTVENGASSQTRAPVTTSTASNPANVKRNNVISINGQGYLTLPSSYYTLQLSSASQPDTLTNFGKQHNLQQFMVYRTLREGKPWYILVSGSYPSSEAAKNAIATLPAQVRAKKPWIRPVSQVQQDLKNNY
ncbi:SPOR domain-containing protein [Serratia microhaemolytica]|uniref:SPOR domain-containing protein n=1 Tax=Serratia microhaemolytica TaxID=2675110 RepID=UPI000FDE9CCE|nr:SPOR domain-containing protein [Serratia microhaemolytica]